MSEVIMMGDQQMNLLGIPEEVIEGSILTFLSWNDLLRFRRVCVTTKQITDGYLRTHLALAPEIEINEEGKSFAAFLEMGIPTTKLFLNNVSGDEFYQKDEESVAKFLQKFGLNVRNLRVNQISLCIFGKELDFLESLVNLQGFQAGCFGYGKLSTCAEEFNKVTQMKRKKALEDPRYVSKDVPLPDVFKRLTHLQIGQHEEVIIGNAINFTPEFLNFAPDLEYASFPFNSNWAPPTSPRVPHDPRHILSFDFMFVIDCIRERAAKFPEKSNLKNYDFSCYHNDLAGMPRMQAIDAASRRFFELCHLCNLHDVRISNVDPCWFFMKQCHPDLNTPDLGVPIVSLIGLDPYIFDLDMPNLEKIVIKSSSNSSGGTQDQWNGRRPVWPTLKHLDITVDSKSTFDLEISHPELDGVVHVQNKTTNLFKFFFRDIRREALTDLSLAFWERSGGRGVAIPKTDEIVASCPNLKKLALSNWPGTNKALTKLWDGLEGLEEISLEFCNELGNVAFVGEDTGNPLFFKLANLRKLSLKNLDKMPNNLRPI